MTNSKGMKYKNNNNNNNIKCRKKINILTYCVKSNAKLSVHSDSDNFVFFYFSSFFIRYYYYYTFITIIWMWIYIKKEENEEIKRKIHKKSNDLKKFRITYTPQSAKCTCDLTTNYNTKPRSETTIDTGTNTTKLI